MSWYQWLQLAFALAVLCVIAERVRALCYRLAISDEALRWLLRELGRDRARVHGWTEARPATQAARLIREHERSEADARELMFDLREEAGARLNVLRVAATLASTLGLLGGILTFSGALAPDAGLLALQAGAVERLTMHRAIATMAIGVGTSALCFQALALLRPAAQKLVAQAQQIAAALG